MRKMRRKMYELTIYERHVRGEWMYEVRLKGIIDLLPAFNRSAWRQLIASRALIITPNESS